MLLVGWAHPSQCPPFRTTASQPRQAPWLWRLRSVSHAQKVCPKVPVVGPGPRHTRNDIQQPCVSPRPAGRASSCSHGVRATVCVLATILVIIVRHSQFQLVHPYISPAAALPVGTRSAAGSVWWGRPGAGPRGTHAARRPHPNPRSRAGARLCGVDHQSSKQTVSSTAPRCRMARRWPAGLLLSLPQTAGGPRPLRPVPWPLAPRRGAPVQVGHTLGRSPQAFVHCSSATQRVPLAQQQALWSHDQHCLSFVV